MKFPNILTPLKVIATASKDDASAPILFNENAKNPYITPYGRPLVSAHRSGAGIVPENTLMAFGLCLNSPEFDIDLFELDVHMTLDGELVVLHNNTYDATSNSEEVFGRKDVRPEECALEQLKVLNLGEHFELDGEYPYRGLRGGNIPDTLRVHKLDEILDFVSANGKKKYYFSIDVKNRGELGGKAADRLYRILGERDLYDRVIAASFNASVTKHYDACCPGMTRSASPAEVLAFYYKCRSGAELGRVNYSLLQIPYGVYRKPWGAEIINLGTRELINYAHKHDIAVQYWTVNRAEDMRKLCDNGADAIMTDYPDLAYATFGRRC
mgnify:CR=1 FL=1